MLATKAALGKIPDFHWCLKKDCGSGQIHDLDEGTRSCPDTLFVCHRCRGRQCTRHAVKWHEGLTCEEYEEGNSLKLWQERASKAMIDEISKPCPSCHRNISKYVGCNHITCKL